MATARRTFHLALTVVALLATPAAAQVTPPRDARPPSQAPIVGTAVVSGTVTLAGSMQPARRVRVNLSGAELRGGRSVITDDQGQFSFTALPPGRYNLSAAKPGHVSVTYGQIRRSHIRVELLYTRLPPRGKHLRQFPRRAWQRSRCPH